MMAALDVAGILAMCKEAVPVNCHVETAVAAHRIAFAQFAESGTNEDQSLAILTLLAVILARTPETDDARTMLDYLSGLPTKAWCTTEGHWVEQIREETLAGIRRSIAWRQQN